MSREQSTEGIEPCPNCETDVLVGGAQGPYYRWQCFGCGERWGEHDLEPISYDDVEAWYEPRSPDGTCLHAERDCASTDAVITHTPSEARENRHERCLTCGHEVVES